MVDRTIGMTPEISNNFTKYSCDYKDYVYNLYFIWFRTYIYPNFKISGDHQVDVVIWVANTHTSTHIHFYQFLFKILEYVIISYSESNIWLFNYTTFCAEIGKLRSWPNQARDLNLQMKFYWNIALFINSHIVYDFLLCCNAKVIQLQQRLISWQS